MNRRKAISKNIRGNDSDEQKKRLEKKRGMKLDDHPQFKKEGVNFTDEEISRIMETVNSWED
jgi:hypothetical protein